MKQWTNETNEKFKFHKIWQFSVLSVYAKNFSVHISFCPWYVY